MFKNDDTHMQEVLFKISQKDFLIDLTVSF